MLDVNDEYQLENRMACHENEVDASRETSPSDIRECGKDRVTCLQI